MKLKPVIFCDFDGTITVNDNIIAIMRHFSPEGWEDLVRKVVDQQMSIQEGVGAMFRLLPSSRKQEVIDFALGNMKIRPGFAELLDYCRSHEVEFLVTSGGIDFFVYPTLEPFGIEPNQVYCNGSDFNGEQVRILWPHACDEECANGGCGMCKTRIIRSYPAGETLKILIGDSVTDFEGARITNVVFARSHLIDKCKELGVPYYPYEDFFDVTERLDSLLREESHKS